MSQQAKVAAQATAADVMRLPLTTVELMTTRPTVITTTTNVRDAAQLMMSGHFRHLPVVGEAGLVGIVDITDVCRALLESDVRGTSETVAGRST
jgi:CBS domain-containing protein